MSHYHKYHCVPRASIHLTAPLDQAILHFRSGRNSDRFLGHFRSLYFVTTVPYFVPFNRYPCPFVSPPLNARYEITSLRRPPLRLYRHQSLFTGNISSAVSLAIHYRVLFPSVGYFFPFVYSAPVPPSSPLISQVSLSASFCPVKLGQAFWTDAR